MVFQIGPYDVVSLVRGQPLRKLATMVRIDFPVRLLLVGTPNLYSDAVDGMTVGIPDCANNQGVGFLLFGLIGGRTGSDEQRRQDENSRRSDNDGGSRVRQT